jgi:acyl-coenzyme A thioesterase PaaI-like protein
MSAVTGAGRDDRGEDELAAAHRAAASVQRLGDALVGHVVDDELLDRVAAAADELAEVARLGVRRDKRSEMASRGRMAEFLLTGEWPGPVGDGEVIEFDHSSFVGGPLNPFAMGATFWRQGDEAHCRVLAGPVFEGPPGRVHGGAIAALMDETMGCLNSVLGTVAFTGRLSVDYLQAAPLGVELRFRSWLDHKDGRKLNFAAEGSAEGVVFARGQAIFVEQDPARLAAL